MMDSQAIPMLSYEKLLNKYNALLQENEELKIQVNELKIKLGMPIETEEKLAVETFDNGINKPLNKTYQCKSFCVLKK